MNITQHNIIVKEILLYVKHLQIISEGKGNIDLEIDDLDVKITDLELKLNNLIDINSDDVQLKYDEILIDFIDEKKLSVRAYSEKINLTLKGKTYFNILKLTNNYMILNIDEWDDNIGLKLYYRTINTYESQKGTVELFYNKNFDVKSGIMSRSSGDFDIKFEIKKIM